MSSPCQTVAGRCSFCRQMFPGSRFHRDSAVGNYCGNGIVSMQITGTFFSNDAELWVARSRGKGANS